MKVIDLLNKIANDEEVPKKVKYENRILYLEDEADEYPPTFNYYDKDGNNALFEGWIGQYLNDEVEIIEEEHKIPEKIDLYEETQNIIRENNYKLVYHDIHKCIVNLECKYNQLIDYLEKIE